MKEPEDLEALDGITLLTRYTMALLLAVASRSFLPRAAKCCAG